MLCVRCGTVIEIGKILCLRCGTAINVNEEALSKVNVNVLENGDIIYFMPENDAVDNLSTARIPEEAIKAQTDLNSVAVLPSPTNFKSNTLENDEADTRKMVFKHINSASDDLSTVRKNAFVLVDPIADSDDLKDENSISENAAISDASKTVFHKPFSDKQTENDSDDFWNNIEIDESKLSNKESTFIKEAGSTYLPSLQFRDSSDKNEPASTPQNFEYKTEYEKNSFNQGFAPNYDIDYRDRFGIAPISTAAIEYYSSPKEKSMSPGEWLGTVLLLLIPGINLILLVIWSLGGCRKQQKTLFARAVLLILLIALVIFLILYFVLMKDLLKPYLGYLPLIRDNILNFVQNIFAKLQRLIK